MTALTTLSDRDHNRFQALIQSRIGILAGRHRHLDLARAIGLAADQTVSNDLDAYYQALTSEETSGELWSVLIQYVTVGETYFFRNPAHTRILKTEVLPELIRRHRHDRRLRIWSAGCASGEEPYSIAIYLDQLLYNPDQWDIQILATDINQRSLQRAREGRYRMWSLRATPDAMRDLYFTSVETPDNTRGMETFELAPRIRAKVQYAYLNLAEDAYPSPTTDTTGLDLILFRNVAIYLPKSTTEAIAGRFHDCLTPGGWLLVGAAETDDSLFGQFGAHRFPGGVVYQRSLPRHEAASLETQPGAPQAAPSSAPTTNTRQHIWPETLETEPEPEPDPAPSPGPKVESDDAAQAAYQEGLLQLQIGNYDRAEIQLASCLAIHPMYAPAHAQMAHIRANQGKPDEALRWCASAKSHDPLLADAYTISALVYWDASRPAEALDELKKALYLAPSDPMVHISLASVHEQLGHKHAAVRHRAQAARLADGRSKELGVATGGELT